MSGGSYNYICYTLSNSCEGQMYDIEMDDLIKDLCEVLHDLEWWQSGDISEEGYRSTLTQFKKKWFQDSREERLKKYIDEQIGNTRKQLCELINPKPEQEPFINKPCISENACKHDKIAAIKKIRDEIAESGSLCAIYAITDTSEKGIEKLIQNVINQIKKQVLNIIDRHKEEQEAEDD